MHSRHVKCLVGSLAQILRVCLILGFISPAHSAVPEMLEIEVVDPNPTLISAAGELIALTTPEAVDLFTGNLPHRDGVIADGISSLLLRARASNAVTFSLARRLGQLRAVGEGAQDSHIVVANPRAASDGSLWVFVLYVPPSDLPGAAVRRTINISAHDETRTGSLSLRLENPPVLPIHGLWSNSSTWNGLIQFLKRHGFRICEGIDCTVNYGAVQPAPSFDPAAGAPEDQFAVNQLIHATTNTLNALRREGIAGAQVDVVAHSLGGLIARSRAALTNGERAYRRHENFQRGDFHKLITVGTPHRGTPVANFLIANRNVRSSFLNGATLEEYLALTGRPLGSAIEEMQPQSPALTNLGSTLDVPSHAIVGIAPADSGTEQLLDRLPSALGYLLSLDSLLGGNGNHDTLVPRGSQAGGLTDGAVTLVRRTVHADIDEKDTGETESRIVWRRIAQLLRATTDSKHFGTFTGFQTNGVAVVHNPFSE